jgi:hypothetical protein
MTLIGGVSAAAGGLTIRCPVAAATLADARGGVGVVGAKSPEAGASHPVAAPGTRPAAMPTKARKVSQARWGARAAGEAPG